MGNSIAQPWDRKRLNKAQVNGRSTEGSRPSTSVSTRERKGNKKGSGSGPCGKLLWRARFIRRQVERLLGNENYNSDKKL